MCYKNKKGGKQLNKITKVLIGFVVIATLVFGVIGIVDVFTPDKPNMPVATQLSDVVDP